MLFSADTRAITASKGAIATPVEGWTPGQRQPPLPHTGTELHGNQEPLLSRHSATLASEPVTTVRVALVGVGQDIYRSGPQVKIFPLLKEPMGNV
jgi:hypothetical protein